MSIISSIKKRRSDSKRNNVPIYKRLIPYSSANRRRWQIGRVTHGRLNEIIGTKMLKIILPRLYLFTTLRSLTIAANVKVELFTSYPPHLTRLTFGAYFMGPIGSMILLPEGLHELIFSKENLCWNDSTFERLILPSSLRILRLCGQNFRQSISHLILPIGLIELEISGNSFKRSIEHLSLPEGMTRFICSSFARAKFIKLRLPSTLTELKLGSIMCHSSSMSQWIPPPSLTRLSTCSQCQLRGDPPIKLPLSFFTYELPHSWSTMLVPSSLSDINFCSYLTRVVLLDGHVHLSTVHFPPSVTSIELSYNYEVDLSADEWNSPPNLRELILGSRWRRELTNTHETSFTFIITYSITIQLNIC